jgi:hypothetical protein
LKDSPSELKKLLATLKYSLTLDLSFTLMLAVMSKKAIGVFGIPYKHCLVMVEFGGTGMLRRYIRNYNQN